MNWAYFTSNSITAPKEVSCFYIFLRHFFQRTRLGGNSFTHYYADTLQLCHILYNQCDTQRIKYQFRFLGRVTFTPLRLLVHRSNFILCKTTELEILFVTIKGKRGRKFKEVKIKSNLTNHNSNSNLYQPQNFKKNKIYPLKHKIFHELYSIEVHLMKPPQTKKKKKRKVKDTATIYTPSL